MTKFTIAKVLFISLMIFAKETIQAQWNGTTSPLTTIASVGIGTAAPTAPLQIHRNTGNAFVSNSVFGGNPFTPNLRLSNSDSRNITVGTPPFQVLTQVTTNYAWDFNPVGKNLNIDYLNLDIQPTTQTTYTFGPNGPIANTTTIYPRPKASIILNPDSIKLDTNTVVKGKLDVRFNLTCNQNIISKSNLFVQNNQLINVFQVDNTGKTVIGNSEAIYHPDAKLHVAGKVAAQHFVITKPTNWSDKVFDKNYKLLSLSEIEQFILKNKHLPEVPSEAEVMEKGYDTNEMDALLLQKIEELTLHLIELKKENETLKKDISNLKK